MARSAALFLASLASGLATLGIDRGEQPNHLRAAEAIIAGGELDAPHGIGFPLLIAPAQALGGTTLVEILLAVIAALAFVLGAALARRLVPEPWATGGVAAVALSAPAVAYGAAVRPDLTAGALLAGAALLALRVRENPSTREAVLAGLLIALLPWLGTPFLVPGLPILAAMAWWLFRRNRGLPAIFALEVVAASLIAWVSVNEALYDRPTPPADRGLPAGSPERLVSLWLDRDHGLLRWAPVIALAFLGAWLLWRSRRERLSRAVPEVRDREAAAELLLLVFAAQVLVAAFGVLRLEEPVPLVAALPCGAALVAWGLRHHPRVGGALAALSLAATAWLLATGLDLDTSAPWGPLVEMFPVYGTGSAWAHATIAGVVAALLVLLAREGRAALK